MFSQTYTTGSFHTAAKLRPSWKEPSFVAPSPIKDTATLSLCCILNASAAPAAIGIFPPTMAFAGGAPIEKSPVCIAPPLPLQQPSALPNISHIIARSDTPFARSCPAGRCVEKITSSRRRSYIVPTAVASSPALWWMVPGIIPSKNRYLTVSSY